VDTALFGAPHAVRCVLDLFGPSQVLFGTDMPLGPPDAVEMTIADLEATGLSDEELAAVYEGNAVRLLGLQAGDRHEDSTRQESVPERGARPRMVSEPDDAGGDPPCWAHMLDDEGNLRDQ
jgi:hypothetical protein